MPFHQLALAVHDRRLTRDFYDTGGEVLSRDTPPDVRIHESTVPLPLGDSPPRPTGTPADVRAATR
jgi:hypothetical protein